MMVSQIQQGFFGNWKNRECNGVEVIGKGEARACSKSMVPYTGYCEDLYRRKLTAYLIDKSIVELKLT